jgi:hypothetical protein
MHHPCTSSERDTPSPLSPQSRPQYPVTCGSVTDCGPTTADRIYSKDWHGLAHAGFLLYAGTIYFLGEHRETYITWSICFCAMRVWASSYTQIWWQRQLWHRQCLPLKSRRKKYKRKKSQDQTLWTEPIQFLYYMEWCQCQSSILIQPIMRNLNTILLSRLTWCQSCEQPPNHALICVNCW